MARLGKCKLCGRQAELVKSHIIPEWVFTRLYDQKHRLLRVASHKRSPVGFKPKGEWGRFLCDACESRFKTLDEYGRAVIFSSPHDTNFGMRTEKANHGMNILNVDYARLKLFQLSVLWRATVCDRDFFSEIDIGGYEETIRDMLIAEDPGPALTFGCIMSVVRPRPDLMLHELIDQPVMCSQGCWTTARFLFAGCVWLYVICPDAWEFPLKRFFASPSSPLPVLITELSDLPGLIEKIKWLRDQMEDRDRNSFS